MKKLALPFIVTAALGPSVADAQSPTKPPAQPAPVKTAPSNAKDKPLPPTVNPPPPSNIPAPTVNPPPPQNRPAPTVNPPPPSNIPPPTVNPPPPKTKQPTANPPPPASKKPRPHINKNPPMPMPGEPE